MKNTHSHGDATAKTPGHSYVLRGLSPTSALPLDPDLTILEVVKIYRLPKSKMESMLILGMLRFRMIDKIVFFRQSELDQDLEFAMTYFSFKTCEEKNAFLIGARKSFPFMNFSSHYVYKKNKGWIDQIVYL